MKNPTQPIYDDSGVPRFKANDIVRYLLDWATERGCGLNELALIPFSDDDRRQFAQLLGRSIARYNDLFEEELLPLEQEKNVDQDMLFSFPNDVIIRIDCLQAIGKINNNRFTVYLMGGNSFTYAGKVDDLASLRECLVQRWEKVLQRK